MNKARKILMGNEMENEIGIRVNFDMKIPAEIIMLKDLFKAKGAQLFVVGGAVRDSLLGKAPKDFDLATNALPDEIVSIFTGNFEIKETFLNKDKEVEGYILKNGLRLNFQGKQFGIIAVYNLKDLPTGVEIATFRKDLSGGRRPDAVEFTSIFEDVKRRDLTINALFYDLDTREVVDLVGGIDDLRKGIIRTVGSAKERFTEDRLRILRAIRFAGRFGSELHEDIDAFLLIDSKLDGVSGERIRDEFMSGIKNAKKTSEYLKMIEKYDLFKYIFPGLIINKNFIDSNDTLLVITTLLKNNCLKDDNCLEILAVKLNTAKYSKNFIKSISFLISMLKLSEDNAYVLKKAQRNSFVEDKQLSTFLKMNSMDSKLIKSFLKFQLTISSKELIASGFKESALGEEIKRLETLSFTTLLK